VLKLFDEYEIRARIAPTLLVLLPLAAPATVIVNAFALSVAQTGLSTLGAIVLAYGASFWVRGAGRRREQQLWADWGGPPSTVVILRDTDDTFSQDLRARILTRVKERFRIAVDTESPDAPRQVADAFKLVRKRVAQLDSMGLWTKHNAEYGFLRNLWGSYRIWLGVDALAASLCGFMWWADLSVWAPVGTLLNVAAFPIILLVQRFVLPDLLRQAAYRYVESAWVSFLHTEGQP
jgi:hypothetical protein